VADRHNRRVAEAIRPFIWVWRRNNQGIGRFSDFQGTEVLHLYRVFRAVEETTYDSCRFVSFVVSLRTTRSSPLALRVAANESDFAQGFLCAVLRDALRKCHN
jgi:hypothetical protein